VQKITLATIGRIAALSASLIGLSHATARADLGACGEVDVRAQAQCVVIPPSAECKTMCTPISVRATCSAKLAASCDASCNELPSIDCSASCEAGCRGRCEVDPGKFECAVDCRATCTGSCEASCAANSDKTGCMASCSGACSVGCDKQCDVELPSASCDVECKASCEGSCDVQTNIDCQVDCQAKGYVDCQADVTGGCMTRCEAEEGALFCDGQFVDTGDKLDECVAALKAILNAKVDASARGSSDCEGGTCSAEGEASVSSDCAVTRVGGGGARTGLYPLLGLLGVGFVVRRRRKR
jgi:MYXO-CTERM domain-containing protein